MLILCANAELWQSEIYAAAIFVGVAARKSCEPLSSFYDVRTPVAELKA